MPDDQPKPKWSKAFSDIGGQKTSTEAVKDSMVLVVINTGDKDVKMQRDMCYDIEMAI